MPTYEQLAKRYKRVTWIGIVLNCSFIFPLLFAPRFALDILQLNVEPLIFGRIPGLLLLWISVFYIPAAYDLKRYRVHAWLAMFPSRIGGASFFFGAVFLFGYPLGYLPIAIIDASILLLQLNILLKVRAVESGSPSVTGAQSTKTHKLRNTLLGLAVLVVVGALGVRYKLFREVDQHFDSQTEYFKYGSIGTEAAQGIPFWIWLVLPRVFPEYLPGPGGYNSLGLYSEPGHATPVGLSVKTIGFDRVGVNCAFCHSATVRLSAGEDPTFVPGGPSTTMDVLGYQRFLFSCASDPRFNANVLMKEVSKVYKLSYLDQVIYRYLLIPAVKKALLKTKEQFAWTNSRPDWGRGRIDPFNPVKVGTLHVPIGDTIGNSDMEPIWNMRQRQGLAYHWDGLNTNLEEVVRSSAIGDGATPKSIPLGSLQALQDWMMDLKPPAYPRQRFAIDAALASSGKTIFDRDCASCHAYGGKLTGHVIPVEEAGTDPHRAAIWTKEAAVAYNEYAKGYSWAFSNFRSTGGYLCVPLDGIWARGPYLHNGSVPTLRDLLDSPPDRPKVFYKGYNVIDAKKVGFISQGPDAERDGFRYDVSIVANSNQGHVWGTQLPPRDKDALVEYMKTL